MRLGPSTFIYCNSITKVLVHVNIFILNSPSKPNIASRIEQRSDSITTDNYAADCSKVVLGRKVICV